MAFHWNRWWAVQLQPDNRSRSEKIAAWLRYNKIDVVGFLVIGWFLDAPGCVFDMSPTACKMYYAVDDFFHPPSAGTSFRSEHEEGSSWQRHRGGEGSDDESEEKEPRDIFDMER